MLHQQRRLADLTEAEGEAFVTRLFHGNLVERSLLRGLTLPIKAAYFDDPVVYAALGQRHRPAMWWWWDRARGERSLPMSWQPQDTR
jgi:hypothetical protein